MSPVLGIAGDAALLLLRVLASKINIDAYTRPSSLSLTLDTYNLSSPFINTTGSRCGAIAVSLLCGMI